MLDAYIEALESREDYLLSRLFEYASASEYTRYASEDKEEDWRQAVQGPAEALVRYLRENDGPESIHADERFDDSPHAAFAKDEARRHRERGVSFVMFLAVSKLLRQSFVDLVYETDLGDDDRRLALEVTHRFWDKFELGFSSDWIKEQESDLVLELQDANRQITGEKNKYRTIFRSMSEPVFVVDKNMRLTDVNPALERMLGMSSDQIIGRYCHDVLLTDLCGDCPLEKAIETRGDFSDVQGTLDTPDNHKDILFSGFYINDISGRHSGGVGILQDITEQQAVDQALDESEKAFASLFQSMAEGVSLHDLIYDDSGRPVDYRILEVNPAYEIITGLRRDQAIGRRATDLYGTDDAPYIDIFAKVASTGKSTQFDTFFPPMEKHFSISVVSLREGQFATVFSDITALLRAQDERLDLERRVQHSQKLESLGVLAGGIAHDFNNLLMGILGNADMAQEEISPLSPAHDSIRSIETSARRAAELSKQMLAYSGKGKFRTGVIDLNRMIEESGRLLEVSISKRATLSFGLSPEIPCVEADPVQLRQVVMNLITNASEAIGDRGGVISVTTGAMECDADYLCGAYVDENLPEGLYVYTEVNDTGCGMSEETLQRLFDPFFTTKFTGRGLGMSAVLGIVRGHKGAIKVLSEVDKGTSVKILLPASGELVEGPADTEEDADWQGSGTILLVDDEETVRVVAKRMLTRLGFDVITADDGREAVDIARERHDEIDCVILDFTMTHMDGVQTFRELRRVQSDMRVILASGYSEDEIADRFAGKGLSGVIQKPYSSDAIAAKLREALGE